jgi:hypothetical protein
VATNTIIATRKRDDKKEKRDNTGRGMIVAIT